jgi:gliding motility-associated lipoprotein GldH
MRNACLLLMLIFLGLASCQTPAIYQDFRNFEQGIWVNDSILTFTFPVTDPSQPYDLYYHVRNTLDYPYSNLYIKYELQDSTGKIIRANMHETYLMEPVTGKPYGKGVGDFFDHKVKVLEQVSLPYAGNYRFQIKQYMRPDTLVQVMSVGFSVENSTIPGQ